jgi:hypothetical protein
MYLQSLTVFTGKFFLSLALTSRKGDAYKDPGQRIIRISIIEPPVKGKEG